MALLVAVVPGSGLTRPTAVRAADVGLPPFGVTLGGDPSPKASELAAGAKAGYVSLLFSWAQLQPKEGTWDEAAVARLDARIVDLNAHGLKVLAGVGDAPAWAAAHPNGPLLDGKSKNYIGFLHNLIGRYRAPPYNVHQWLLWSEPDAVRTPKIAAWAGRGAWGDDGAAFADVMTQAYAKIKSLDPDSVVILGPLAYDFFDDPPASDPSRRSGGTSPGFNSGGLFKYTFIDDVLTRLASTGAPAFDAVAINAYVTFGQSWEADALRYGRTGVDVAAKVNQLRSRLAAYGVDVPILIGESGFWSKGPPVGASDGRGNAVPPGDDQAEITPTPRTQAEYVGKLFSRALDAGVASLTWFSLEEVDPNQSYGLVGAAGPKDAYRAYRWAATALGDAQQRSPTAAVSPVDGGSVESYGFTGPSGLTIVAWAQPRAGMTKAQAAAPTARVAVPPTFKAYDLFGQPVAPAGSAGGRALYDLTSSPVFFKG